jgi:uncharacterized protein
MSPRNKRIRKVGSPPVFKGFKPIGLPTAEHKVISLLYEEYEAFRLIDYSELSQEEASKIMNVSRPTFTRIYNSGLKKIALAFAEGLIIHIEGGNVVFDKEWYKCHDCVTVFHHEDEENQECISCDSDNIEHINKSIENWKENQGSKEGMPDPGVMCICTKCRHEELHIRGVPCFSKACPECHSPLIRKGNK